MQATITATNTRLGLKRAGVDGRTVASRRFRQLLACLSRDFGGFDALAEADQSIIRQAAATTMQSEALQAALVRGERVDSDELIRLASECRRLMGSIRKRAPVPTGGGSGGGDMRSYLASKRTAA